MRAGFGRLSKESVRPSCPNLCEHRLRNAEAGLLKLSDGHVEVDETGLFTFIEDGKRAGDLQAPANCFLPSLLLVHEHHVGMNLRRECDRLALAEVELPQNLAAFSTQDLHPIRRISGPVLDRFRRDQMFQFRQHGRWNQNPRVQQSEEVDMADQHEVVDRRCIGDDDYRAQC